jgi:hypothetical protein
MAAGMKNSITETQREKLLQEGRSDNAADTAASRAATCRDVELRRGRSGNVAGTVGEGRPMHG